jgi:vacuolar-type H+-ATPase subunit H
VEKLDYDIYQLTGLEATGRFTPNHLLLTSYKGQIGDSDFAGSGELTNVWNYVFYDEVLGGEINFRSAFMNLNQFMTEEPVPAGEEPVATEPILVPENVSMIVHSQIGKVLYDDMELTDVRGDLIVADQQVRFDGVKGQLLGGGIEMKGGYDTREPEKPAFDLAMKLQQMDFQKTFNAFNTVQAIAPIGKYLRGSFNTEFSMKSLLTKDLMPDLNSLDLDAFIQTSTATIAGFAPLEEVANKLNVEELKTLVIKESKNWFTVKNGTVTLEDFDYTYNDIPLHIGGQHKITGEMDYKIIASIPREKIGKNPVGGSALSGLDYLSSEASKLGVNINAGDFINVEIGLAGSLTQPKVNLKVLGSGGKSSLKDAVASSVKTEANKQLDSAKAEVKSAIEEEKKQVTETAAKALEETKKAVDTTAKKVVEDLKKGSTEEAKKTVDEAKKKVEDINPFKKKKKGGG